MAKKIDFDFPRFMNEYPLFVYIPIDYIAVAFLGYFFCYWFLAFLFGTLIGLFVGVIPAVPLFLYYKHLKKEQAPGFLYHLFFTLGWVTFEPDLDDEELKNLDIESFVPSGYETIFED